MLFFLLAAGLALLAAAQYDTGGGGGTGVSNPYSYLGGPGYTGTYPTYTCPAPGVSVYPGTQPGWLSPPPSTYYSRYPIYLPGTYPPPYYDNYAQETYGCSSYYVPSTPWRTEYNAWRLRWDQSWADPAYRSYHQNLYTTCYSYRRDYQCRYNWEYYSGGGAV